METNPWKQRYDQMVATCAHTAKERDEALAALSGRTVSCERCNEMARQIAEKDAQIKHLCQDWADDDTRIKEIAKAHGIDVEANSVADGYFRTCLDVAEKMSEALTSKDAQIVALREALTKLLADTGTHECGNGGKFFSVSQRQARCALLDLEDSTLPPAVVPLEEAKKLSDALDDAISLIDRCSMDETPGDFSETYRAVQDALANFTAKHP